MHSATIATPRHGMQFGVPTNSAGRPPLRGAARRLAFMLLLAAAYDLAVRLGLGFRFENSQIGVVWPGNAVLVAALVLTPRSRWWMAFVAVAIPHAIEMHASVPAWRWLWQIKIGRASCRERAEIW